MHSRTLRPAEGVTHRCTADTVSDVAHELDTAKYISFTSFKRDGSAVATPVWVVPFEGGYAFTTGRTSFKLKRIVKNPAVTIAVCSMRGNMAEGATQHRGTAIALDEQPAARVNSAIRRKYWFVYNLTIAPAAFWQRLRGNSAADAAIKVSLDA